MALGTAVGEHQGWNTYQRGGSGAVTVASWSGRDASSWGSGFSDPGEQGGMEQVAGEVAGYTFAELLTRCVSGLR